MVPGLLLQTPQFWIRGTFLPTSSPGLSLLLPPGEFQVGWAKKIIPNQSWGLSRHQNSRSSYLRSLLEPLVSAGCLWEKIKILQTNKQKNPQNPNKQNPESAAHATGCPLAACPWAESSPFQFCR